MVNPFEVLAQNTQPQMGAQPFYMAPAAATPAPQPQVLYAPQQAPQAAPMQQPMQQQAAPMQQPIATPTTGAMPVGVEPLHQFEKAGLAGLGTYQTPAAVGQATTALTSLLQSPAAQAMQQPMTQAQFEAGISRYTSPYQQQVTNYALQDITDRAEQLRNRIMSRNPGARSFGSSSQGVQLSELGRNELQALGRTSAEAGARGFEGAVSNLFGEQNQMRGNIGTLSSLATGLGGLGTQQQAADLRTLLANVGAGQDIRQYNQGLSDIAMANYMGAQNYPITRLSQLGQMAGVIPSSQYAYNTQPSSGQQTAGILTALGSLFGQPQTQAIM